MKNILFFLLIIKNINAQNKRFIYDYQFVSDSTKHSEIKSETMYLDIRSNGSVYYSSSAYVNDSTMIADAKLGKMTMPEGKINERVCKNYPDYKTFLCTKFYIEKYKVLDERQQNWKIHKVKDKISGFNVQKASLDFAGRKWIAWFTTEIPIQDGPYKFHGLPGLILKIEDETKSHCFVLKGMRSLSNNTVYPNIDQSKKEIEINQRKYGKLFKEYRQDPVKDLKQLFNEGKMVSYTDRSGNIVTPSQIIKNLESERKRMMLKDNNIIELDLLQ
ncbi:GLPGLI family protein [Chryseobacterium sp. X308]|uniref:GLPGLI family protein n=1 Tax=Chryseobacterium sp. X308 TaxID=2884873 RepID=UPI001D15285A|nr:GLPGLI family protein [Chryseobacterium sp. X308]MCC3213655.1 GLPGLI family protein [Chryseobacterium sp. X308]